MHPRIYLLLAFTGLILAGCNAAAEKEQSSKEKSAGGATYNSYQDDIYIEDQEGLEGSGRGGGEVRDDLESSGSGFGPDDEDGEDGRSIYTNPKRIEPEGTKPEEPRTPSIEEPVLKKETNEETQSGPDPDQDPSTDDRTDDNIVNNGGVIMNPKTNDHASSFFAQPGVLAAVIGGAVVGLLCAILVVMFIVYRMRKKDEGSYALDEPRRSPAAQAYPKPGAPHHNREFYA